MRSTLSTTARIAAFSFRRKWLVFAAWLIMFLVAGTASSGLGDVLSNEMKDLTGSDSARATEILDQRFDDQPLTELLVIRSERTTVDDSSYQSTVRDLANALIATPGVAHVATFMDTGDPGMVSPDQHATLTQVTLSGADEEAEEHIEGILTAVRAQPIPDGFTVEITGDASLNHEFGKIYEDDLRSAELFGLPVALIVLLVAFGALIAAFVPLVLGLFAIALAMGSLTLIGRAFALDQVVTNVVTMIGLAVGVDYALFIIGRYREELARGHARPDALAIAADSSGRAVLFSGITVLLALAGMLFVRNSTFIGIGIGAMVVVFYAILASLTLLPAVLALVGRGINWLRVPFLGRAAFGTRFWGMVTNAVQRRPAVFTAVAAGLLIAAALPLTTINLGVGGAESLPHDTSGYRAIQSLERDFAAGRLDPMQVVVDGDISNPAVQQAIARFEQGIASRPDMQWVGVTPDSEGRTAVIEVASTQLGTGADAQRVVRELREDLIPAAFDGSGADVLLGGNTAMFVDVKGEMDAKLPVVFGFVLSLSFVLLLLVFRSVVIPAKAILMNLLSVGAAYGILVLVFQHGFGADLLGFKQVDQIEFYLPLFLFSILFGLSMDYHVFLLSRVKEEYDRTGDNRQAVATGVRSTAGMITSAALIMVTVFSAFAQGRMSDLQQMGFGLAVAIFLDATIIRSVLVPASMQLLGRYNWWMPSWLGWLPKLTVEGSHSPAAAASAGD